MRVWSKALTAIIFCLTTKAASFQPSEAEFLEIKDLGLKIISQFPSDSHFILSIGRSLTGITTYLKNLGYSHLSTLPLSNIHKLNQAKDPDLLPWLFLYFDQFIPRLPDKTLVFVDFSLGGRNYLLQKKYIEMYYQTQAIKQKYQFVAIVWHQNQKLINQLKLENVLVIPFKSNPNSLAVGPRLIDRLINSDYDEFHEYKEFEIGKFPLLNPAFAEFSRSMKSYMCQSLFL